MRKLDLSENPLSDEGACALFRLIIGGLPCFVMMRDCTLAVDTTLFNGTFPADASPYRLDLSKPYDAAVLSELCYISFARPSCQFRQLTYTSSSGRETQLGLNYQKKVIVEKGGREDVWEMPESGNVYVDYYQKMLIPSTDLLTSDAGLNVLKTIIIFARSPFDRKKWLKLLCANIYLTTVQAQDIIDSFTKTRNIFGVGGINKVDVVAR